MHVCKEDTFNFRRGFLKEALKFKLHLSTAPPSLELMDYYLNYRAKKEHLQFRFGQYKVPFTRYRIQSFQRLTFVDWSIVTRYFRAERVAKQLGFELKVKKVKDVEKYDKKIVLLIETGNIVKYQDVTP